MTDRVDLDRVDALCEQATPGPIVMERYDHGGGRAFVAGDGRNRRALVADFYHTGDREFFFNCITLVPAMASELRAARSRVLDLESVITAAAEFRDAGEEGEWGEGTVIFRMAEDNDRLSAELRAARARIADLEQVCDPAGDLRSLRDVTEQRDAMVARIAELEAEAAKHERDEGAMIDDVDRANDALQQTHIALGGDGVWAARIPTPPPPDTGDLSVDVPVLAEIVRRRLAELEAIVGDLLRTKDGVPAAPLNAVYGPVTGRRYVVIDSLMAQQDRNYGEDEDHIDNRPIRVGEGEYMRIDCCYSTREAALAAVAEHRRWVLSEGAEP